MERCERVGVKSFTSPGCPGGQWREGVLAQLVRFGGGRSATLKQRPVKPTRNISERVRAAMRERDGCLGENCVGRPGVNMY